MIPASESDEEEMVDYETSSTHESMDVDVVYLSSLDYSFVGNDDVTQMEFGLKDATFQKCKESDNHLKPLYIHGQLDDTPNSPMLLDGGAIINLMSYFFQEIVQI
jgi:hypothetical protein